MFDPEPSIFEENLESLPEDTQKVISILNQKLRREHDISVLVPLLSKIKFFKDNKLDDTDLAFICKKLTYEFVPAGFDVITFGEFGDKFYITLHGNTGVLIPDNSKQQSLSSIEEAKSKGDKKQENKMLKKNKALKQYQLDMIMVQIEKNKKPYNEVAVLPAGCSFGELALINNKPRAATIRAKTS